MRISDWSSDVCSSDLLKRAGHDLRGRGRTTVDQNDHREALQYVAGRRVEALGVLFSASAGRDDLALIEECIGHADRLVEEPSGIVAQVQHEAEQRDRKSTRLNSSH